MSRTKLLFLFELGAVYLEDRRANEDQPVVQGQLIRLHLEPRRFPEAIQQDWGQLLVEKTADFIVINKPAGVPIHATVDNQIENALFQTAKILKEKLYPVHRLDVNTSGLCVFGRNPEFQKSFHQILKHPSSEKIYLALCSKPAPLGLHTHYMEKQKRPPHKMFGTDGEDRKLCRLEIQSVSELNGRTLTKIKLLTGRTHQIRAQMAFLDCPLTGDLLYAPDTRGPFFLHSAELRFTYLDHCYEFETGSRLPL